MAERISDQPQISVDANLIPTDSFDCGILRLRWCRGQFCLKQAKLINFILTLTSAGVLQGACIAYFRISAQLVAAEYNWSDTLVEWLTRSSGLFQFLIALCYAYWALKIHPTSWLGGTFMLQAIVCVIAVIPPIVNVSEGHSSIWAPVLPDLCTNITMASQKALPADNGLQWGQLVLFFVLQMMLALGLVSYITVGLTYIDDNSSSLDSPAALAATLAALVFGYEMGGTFIMLLYEYHLKWWLGWLVLALLLFMKGLILSLFPKRLPKTVVHQTAQRIVEETRSRQFGSAISTYMDDPDFWPTLKRLFTNKLLLVNIFSIACFLSAYCNYMSEEQHYLQSRFLLPLSERDGWIQEWRARYIAYFLRSPAMAVGMLLAGLLISKFKITARCMLIICLTLLCHIVLVYIGFIFVSCNTDMVAGVSHGKLLQPFCSNQCICNYSTFMPVCAENSNLTYYSPCYAGCNQFVSINNIEFYAGCTCGSSYDYKEPNTVRATEGACNAQLCFGMLTLFQVGVLGISFLLGIVIVMQLVVGIRSVLPQDKGLALALGLTITAFFNYLVIKLVYKLVTGLSCSIWSLDSSACLLYESPKHGNILNILTASLTLVAILLNIAVCVWVKSLNMYNVKARDGNFTPSLYTLIPNEEAVANNNNTTQSNQNIQSDARENGATTATIRSPRPTGSQLPRSEISVFRQTSNVTTASSTSETSHKYMDHNAVVHYAQVFSSNDDKSSSSSNRLVVTRAEHQLHQLTQNDVRSGLQNLKSFQPKRSTSTETDF